MTETYSGVNKVEQYIEQTKENIDKQLPDILKHHRDNITKKERQTLKKLKTSKSEVTIKPADKNLGVVILNTNDYIQQCMYTIRLKHIQTNKLIPTRTNTRETN